MRWRRRTAEFELALFLTLPATVALVVCGVPIITGLFQHGHFTAMDAVRSCQALAAFSVGLPSYILVKVLTPGYYARSDTRTPMRFAIDFDRDQPCAQPRLHRPPKHVGPPLATALRRPSTSGCSTARSRSVATSRPSSPSPLGPAPRHRVAHHGGGPYLPDPADRPRISPARSLTAVSAWLHWSVRAARFTRALASSRERSCLTTSSSSSNAGPRKT